MTREETAKILEYPAPDQQNSAKLDRSRWEGCRFCNDEEVANFLLSKKESYCPYCGRPLTEEAWAELEGRINGGTTD